MNNPSLFSCEIFQQPPVDFSPTVEVAGCFCECQNKFLLLKRHPLSPQGNTWGIPAGKLEKGETPQQAAIRETQEETNINLQQSRMRLVGTLYVRHQHQAQDFIFHMFAQSFSQFPSFCLNEKEHVQAQWVAIEEALQMPLIAGGKEAVCSYQLHKRSLRGKTFVNVYLLLYKEGNILLSLRHNTGYADGYYGLVAGNVEGGESAQTAMIREAEEEIGILIPSDSLKLVHTLHRKSDRENIDLFFSCTQWTGTITNREEHKCKGLHFYDPLNLPENTLPYIIEVLQHIRTGLSFSESGWESCPS